MRFLHLHVKQKAFLLPLFLFLLSSTNFEQTGKSFLSVFNPLLPRMRAISIGPVSLGTLANIYSRCWRPVLV